MNGAIGGPTRLKQSLEIATHVGDRRGSTAGEKSEGPAAQPTAWPDVAPATEGPWRFLIERVPDVIWTADMSLRRTFVSQSVTRQRGYTVAEVLAQSVGDALTPESRQVAEEALRHARARERRRPSALSCSRTLVLEMTRKDGSTLWVETHVTFLRDGQGRPVGIVGVDRDISERRQREQMKADFVTLTTHQLRTPLTGIKWLLELAVADPGISPATRVQLRDAGAAADRLIEIVNNLLDSANLETGTLNVTAEATHLGELTRSVLEEMDPGIQDKHCLLSVSGAEAIGTLMADPQLLRQAVLNLVSNAVKYTPPFGRLAIRMRREPTTASWEIEDSGIGVPAAGQPRLFQKFYRADNACAMAPEGTGLGLYLVRLIIERFRGQVWYRSEEGKGSTFGFTLPLKG